MEIHRSFKTNEHILEYFLARLSCVTYVITMCSSPEWINTFCNRIKLSYIQVHELNPLFAKKIAPMLLVKPSLLYVFSNGTEFWLIKSFLEKCEKFPSLIVTSFNYIMGDKLKITTPFHHNCKNTRSQKLYDINYHGCSLHALITLLKRYNYTYTGIYRYAQGVVFIRNDEYRSLTPFSKPEPSDILTLPNVIYALEHRWPKVQNKCWIQVH